MLRATHPTLVLVSVFITKTGEGCVLDSQDKRFIDFAKQATKEDKYVVEMDARIAAAYGNDDWKKDFGHDMADVRKEKKGG